MMPARDSESRMASLRMPPCSMDAEQAVLGGVMLSPPAWDVVATMLDEADFYRRDHQLIFRAIAELAEKRQPFDSVTVGEWFEVQGESDLVQGGAYLIELASTTPSAANVRAYAAIVKDKAKLRQLIEAGTAIVNAAFDPEGREADEVIAEANGSLMSLGADTTAGGARSMREIGLEWHSALLHRYDNPDEINGVRTPWSTLNRKLVAMEYGHLVIAAGRPSMGKSALAVNLADFCASGDEPPGCYYIDLESTSRALFNRAVSSRSGVPLNFLRNPKQYEAELVERREAVEAAGGRWDGEDTDTYWTRVSDAVRELRAAPLRIDDTPGLNIQRIVARAQMEHRQRPYKVLIVDHLHLIPLPGKTRETVEIGHITSALKQLAKELNIVVVLLSQLNRSLESRADKRPTMADLRESGNIEQDADVILFLYRDDYYADREGRPSKAPDLLEIIVAKQREGEVGTSYAKAVLSCARLEDINYDEVQTILATGQAAQLDDNGNPRGPGGAPRPPRRMGMKPRSQAVPA